VLATLAVAAGGIACASTSRNEEQGVVQIETASVPAVDVRYVGILTNGGGSLLLAGGERDSVFVRYALSAQNKAALFRNQVETIDKEDSIFVAIRPSTGTTIDLQVEMPERVTLGLRDEARDVLVRNIESRVEVAMHAGGSLDFDDIEGPLTILDGGGPIRIHDVRGPIVIRDEGGSVRIREVKNSVRIESRGGDVTLESVGSNVTVSAGPGELTIRGVQGTVSYRKTGPGKVTIEDVTGGVERM
jgi:hypothetical protein